jgi:hypothetical protein
MKPAILSSVVIVSMIGVFAVYHNQFLPDVSSQPELLRDALKNGGEFTEKDVNGWKDEAAGLPKPSVVKGRALKRGSERDTDFFVRLAKERTRAKEYRIDSSMTNFSSFGVAANRIDIRTRSIYSKDPLCVLRVLTSLPEGDASAASNRKLIALVRKMRMFEGNVQGEGNGEIEVEEIYPEILGQYLVIRLPEFHDLTLFTTTGQDFDEVVKETLGKDQAVILLPEKDRTCESARR